MRVGATDFAPVRSSLACSFGLALFPSLWSRFLSSTSQTK